MEAAWYIAYVRSCQERNVQKSLAALGVEHYLPMQKTWRRYSDRRVLKDKLVLPRMIFIHTDDVSRRKLFEQVSYLDSFMMDRSKNRPAVVPDEQLEMFRRIVEKAESPIEMKSTADFAVGERIRITSGPFKDMECEVVAITNRRFVCVRLGLLGTAVTEIDASALGHCIDDGNV